VVAINGGSIFTSYNIPTALPTAMPTVPTSIPTSLPTIFPSYTAVSFVAAAFTSGLGYYSIASSQSGQFVATAVNGGYLYISNNGGAAGTISTYSASGALSWYSIAVSTTGQYMTAIAYSNYIYVSTNYGSTFITQSGAYAYWTGVAITSSNANYQVAVSVYGYPTYFAYTTSPTSTWTFYTGYNGYYFRAVAMSSTGSYVSIADSNYGYVWYTSSFTFLTSPSLTTYSTGYALYSISMSASGQYQVAGYSGGITLSTTYATSWSAKSIQGYYFYGISMSSSGQYINAVAYGGSLWTSAGFGVTFTASTKVSQTANYQAVCSDSTGQYVVVAINGGLIYTSYNIPTALPTAMPTVPTAIPTSLPTIYPSYTAVSFVAAAFTTGLGYYTIASSQSGQYVSTAVNGGYIYVSNGYGAAGTISTYTASGALSWYSIAVSNTGQYMTAVAYSNYIYVSTNYGLPSLHKVVHMLTGLVLLSQVIMQTIK